MGEIKILKYIIRDPIELNLSYMPFITDGGLFIPTDQYFSLNEKVIIELQLPGKKDSMKIEGKVIWITPKNALHHVLPGIGIQFTGKDTQILRSQIESHLDTSMEVGGYTYGMTGEGKK